MGTLFTILFGLAAFGAAAAYEIADRRAQTRALRDRYGDDVDRAAERRRRKPPAR